MAREEELLMRSSWWFCLLAVGIVAANFSARVPRAQGQRALSPPTPPPPLLSEDVPGYGRTPDAAEQVALEKARRLVEAFLRERFAPTGWQVPAELVQSDYLQNREVIRKQQVVSQRKDNREEQFVAQYHVEISSNYLHDVQQSIRQQIVQHRHLKLARILAGLVALLLVCAGYLRLEEATRGYYTRALRLAAVVLVLLASVGLWLSW
jgi:hypothetical protein